MYNWWIAPSARELWPRLVCGFLLLLLEPFGPGRHDVVHARLGHGLAEMLAKVPGDGDEGTAHGGLTVEHFPRLVGGFRAEFLEEVTYQEQRYTRPAEARPASSRRIMALLGPPVPPRPPGGVI